MNAHAATWIDIVPGMEMLLVAVLAVAVWRSVSLIPFKWFWTGAGLWAVAVVMKVGCALPVNARVVTSIRHHLPKEWFIIGAGVFMGVESSFFEMGVTLVAVLIWRKLGLNAQRAIAIGIGAGGCEALVLGLTVTTAFLVEAEGTQQLGPQLRGMPLWWLLTPVERTMAVLGHASSRALILLGVSHRNSMMVFSGFLLFAATDGAAGAGLILVASHGISRWWTEFAALPFALISIPILLGCCRRWWGKDPEAASNGR